MAKGSNFYAEKWKTKDFFSQFKQRKIRNPDPMNLTSII